MSSTESEQKESLKKRKQKEQQDSPELQAQEHRKNEQKGAPKIRIAKEKQDIRDEKAQKGGGLRNHKDEKQGDDTDKHYVDGHKATKQPKRNGPSLSPSSVCMIFVVILCSGVIVSIIGGVLWKMDADHREEVANLQNTITAIEKMIKSNATKLTTEIKALTTKVVESDATKKQQIDDINERINQLNTEIMNMKSILKG